MARLGDLKNNAARGIQTDFLELVPGQTVSVVGGMFEVNSCPRQTIHVSVDMADLPESIVRGVKARNDRGDTPHNECAPDLGIGFIVATVPFAPGAHS